MLNTDLGALGAAYLRRTPPRREALRHSGGESLLCTSPTVTLYLEVELRRERRPGTEQKTSLGFVTPPIRPSLFMERVEMVVPLAFEGMGTGDKEEGEKRRLWLRDPDSPGSSPAPPDSSTGCLISSLFSSMREERWGDETELNKG